MKSRDLAAHNLSRPDGYRDVGRLTATFEEFLLLRTLWLAGKWNLVNDYADYENSSASFYELRVVKNYKPFDFRFI